MSVALYRKYRPRAFEDLLGQEMVVEILRNAAKQDRLAHAYLLYGPRGTGKTTTARLIAKIANCETRANDNGFRAKGEPCNKCHVCLEIDESRGIDVVEIDAASNRGIDEIRNLKEGIRLSPIAYRYKVFIIDEAHMLTREAFNALLKTLEEPPAHAIFILATTESEKIPATILSRTQRFSLKKVPALLIEKKLESICKKEKIDAEPEALELIAIAGDGSVRDSESLLDQIVRGHNKITAETVRDTVGRTGMRKLQEFSELLVSKKLPEALKFITELDEAGVNLVQFAKDLIHYLRKALSLKVNPALEIIFKNDFTKDEIEAFKKIGDSAETGFLIAFLKSLIRSYSDMRYSPFAIVPLEIAVIENLKPNERA